MRGFIETDLVKKELKIAARLLLFTKINARNSLFLKFEIKRKDLASLVLFLIKKYLSH